VLTAIVLAAGASSRMGRAKALLPIGADTFLSRIVRTFAAAGITDTIVVVGHDARAIVERHPDLGARFVRNDRYEQGQLSSLVTALDALDDRTEAVLLTLVDVPLAGVATITAVTACYHETHAPVVRPVRGAQHGHPVLIHRSLFDAIRNADPAAGAKPVLRAHASPPGDVAVEEEGAFFDIDTPTDYERALELERSAKP